MSSVINEMYIQRSELVLTCGVRRRCCWGQSCRHGPGVEGLQPPHPRRPPRPLQDPLRGGRHLQVGLLPHRGHGGRHEALVLQRRGDAGGVGHAEPGLVLVLLVVLLQEVILVLHTDGGLHGSRGLDNVPGLALLPGTATPHSAVLPLRPAMRTLKTSFLFHFPMSLSYHLQTQPLTHIPLQWHIRCSRIGP